MNYPGGIKLKQSHTITYDNRGMNLEKELNISNEYYRVNNIAYIYKKPTPIKITKVDYPSRNKAVIKEAYFEKPSTTDYNGLYKGKYIDFEAKETNQLKSFPLHNIHKHQLKHIIDITNNNGICFLIIRFNKLNKTFLLLGKDLIIFLDNYDKKSIPLEFLEKNAYIIKDKYLPRIDYIEIIDQIYGGTYG